MTGIYHGGDLAVAATVFGDPADGWLDLSTGVNPHPWLVREGVLDALHQLPDSGRLEKLKLAAAMAYGVQDPACIACGPGSQALIQWLPRLHDVGRVAVVTPTYGEHAFAWGMAGHDVFTTQVLPEPMDCDIAVITRPNNPDGKVEGVADITALAAGLAEKGGVVVVDEAFADLYSLPSIATCIPAGIIALRSFGKFYGLPGLRLGFSVSGPDTAARMATALGPWPVSSLATDIGVDALTDSGWQLETRNRLERSAVRLDIFLTGVGFDIAGGTTLFRLAVSEHAQDIHEKLGRAGIYTRRFPENPTWLRFGLPGAESEWTRLEGALTS
ncbi:MAG: threonine-phosphate decarboxylase CobD [Pseudomonadota bacterium]|nr:threonine-phosphate decarboxylase CobD [Pseudomonadota bacterium]